MAWAHLTLQISTSTCAHPVPSTHPHSHSPFLQIHFVCSPSTEPYATGICALLLKVALQAGRPPNCRPDVRRTSGPGAA
jgi:hypothetical protein